MADVFISYSRLDKEFVGQLRYALVSHAQDVWIDWESIPPSQAWWTEIQKGIAKANNFVVVISPNSMGSPICQMEIEYARQLGKRIVPVLHIDFKREEAIRAIATRLANPDQDATRNIWGNRQPHSIFDANDSELKHINYFFFRAEDDFTARFTALFEVIRTDYVYKEQHTILQLRAQEWQRRERNTSFLLLEDELVLAKIWLESSSEKQPHPTDLHREYIAMSEKRTRQLRRIQRTSVIGSIVAVIAIFTALAASTLGIERATQLAAIPPTLTELAGQIHVSETSVASLQLAADALSFVTNLRLGQDSGISYVEVTGPIWLRSNYDDIENLVFRCQLWSEQAGFQVYLHEGTQGAIFLNFQSGNLIVTQQGTTTQIQVANIYSRGRWLKFVVFLIDGRLVVYTDERLQLNQSLQGSSDAGSIILAAQAADTFRIGQDCFDTLTDEQHASSVEQAIRDMGTNFPLH